MFADDMSFLGKVRRKGLARLAFALRPLMVASTRQIMMDYPNRMAFETVGGNQLPGDYYEFGVFKGRSFIDAAGLARNYCDRDLYRSMRLFAFDSFEGLPESKEAHLPAQYSKGAFSASQALFEKNCRQAGLPMDRVISIPGFFSELFAAGRDLSVLEGSKVAVAYIDCDIYEGARDALNFITGRLQTGSALVLDDWNRHHASDRYGIRRAVAEWLSVNPHIKLNHILTTKRALFIADLG
ncbi:TylF/MycF family methyltransferase [Mesorhizobium sp. M0189]|uniref:TylF/MycF/NovP-related O-methyltransferase n=1 Tax=Mesorhizobium sp. M0189 TaxID=2956909 RepID=UPI00333CE222